MKSQVSPQKAKKTVLNNIKEEKDEDLTTSVQANNKKEKLAKDYDRLKDYINESGLSLAFNIIFSELITKQIAEENFFTYTAMRLKEIGKELDKIPNENASSPQAISKQNKTKEEEGVLMTVQKAQK